MKRLLVFVLFLSTIWAIAAQELALDEAITKAAREIEGELPQRAMVLVLNVASPSETFANYVLDELTDQLVMGRRLTIVDRQNLAAIRAEMNFQYSGEVSDESMVSIGRMLGAHYILSGSLTDRGANYRLRLRVIAVETARIQTSIIIDLKKDSQIAYLMGDESAQQEIEREQQRIDRLNREKAKVANVKNNWLSIGMAGMGAGLKYERMLNQYLSIGIDGYANFLSIVSPFDIMLYSVEIGATEIGGNITARYYPFGRAFYIGVGLGAKGFYWSFDLDEKGEPTENVDANRVSYDPFGFTVTPELGWRVDLGNPGGFFMDFGIKVPIMFSEPILINNNETNIFASVLWYFGLFGWAF